jgi:hypothetical protein
LTEHFEGAAVKLRHFVEKEHPVVGKADLSGARFAAPPSSATSETE